MKFLFFVASVASHDWHCGSPNPDNGDARPDN